MNNKLSRLYNQKLLKKSRWTQSVVAKYYWYKSEKQNLN